jgi:hypothetical protein
MFNLMILFLAFSAFPKSASKNAFEKSYPRDNVFCGPKDNKIELLIRGGSKFTEPKEKGYGELIFYRLSNKKPVLMTLSDFKSDTFRLFLGTSPLCSKSHGYKLDEETLVVLFLKENRPFKDKLVLQFFDSKTLLPTKNVDTNLNVDKARISTTGFSVRTFNEIHHQDAGKVSINEEVFVYHEKEFPKWMDYNLNSGFKTNPEMTFQKFPWKKSMQDIKEFLSLSGWDLEKGQFTREIIYLAVNHQAKKRCILFTDKKIKIDGSESWKCHTI